MVGKCCGSKVIIAPWVFLSLCIPRIVNAQEGVYRLARDQRTCFRSQNYVNSQYVEFVGNGNYRRLTREHCGVAVEDRGSWTQARNGVVILRSECMVKNIQHGALRICMSKERVTQLAGIRGHIEAVLASNDKKVFTPEDIRSITGSEVLSESPGVIEHRMMDSITRTQLRGLLDAVETYEKSREQNVFHVQPMIYGAFVVLVWKDSEFGDGSFEYIKKQLHSPLGVQPSGVYIRIDDVTLERETMSPQPFLFFPELKNCIEVSAVKTVSGRNDDCDP